MSVEGKSDKGGALEDNGREHIIFDIKKDPLESKKLYNNDVRKFLSRYLCYKDSPGASISDYEADPPDYCFTATLEQSRKLVGVLCLEDWGVDGILDVKYLAVHPDYRKRNIGKRLVLDVFQIIKGLQELCVYPEKINTGGIQFYHKIGFESLEFDGDYLSMWHGGIPPCVMRFAHQACSA
jgi:ribosomal protein S18 acetylase RimI-like enzyme